MSGELEALLKLVSEGKLTAEEAAPIVAALEEARTAGGRRRNGRPQATAATPRTQRPRDEGQRRGRRRKLWPGGGSGSSSPRTARQIINLQIPLAAAGFAIDQVPGLSPDHRSRIVEAIQTGMTGPILEVSDHGDEVRIVIE